MVLCAHSPVFASMLDGEDAGAEGGVGSFVERLSGEVLVEDARPEAVGTLLALLATGRLGKGEFRR